ALGNETYYRLVGGYLKGDDWTRPRNLTPEYSVFCTQTGQINCLPRELSGLALEEDEVVFGGLRFDKHFSANTFTIEGGYATLEGPTFQTGIGRVQVTDVQRPWARVNFNMLHWNFLAYYDARKAEDQIALSSGAHLFEDSHNLHGEIQGNAEFAGGKGRLVGGIAYNEQDVDTANNQGLQTLMQFAHDEHSQAAFGQFEYNFTTSLKGVLAARWDDSTLHDSQFSPKASLVYGITPNHSIRLNYNEAFQVPNYSEFFLFAPAGAPTRALAPLEQALSPFLGGISLGFDLIPVLARGNDQLVTEDITGYEVGYSGIFGGKIFMTLDYYSNQVENFVTDLLPGVNPQFPAYAPPTALPPQIQQLIAAQLRANVPASLLAGMTMLNGRPAFVFSYTNAGKVDTQGVEIAFNYYLSDSWIVDANYSWFDFEVKEVQLGDKLFPNAPENKYNAGITYRHPKFDVSAKYRWIEDFFWAAGVFAGEIPQYDVLNLSANYHVTNDIVVGANISNVADDEHHEAFGGDLIGRRALGYISFSW
ncbi:MAG TPA: TonB-dependent receptor, partial [Thermoanaerobaculia bacterium]